MIKLLSQIQLNSPESLDLIKELILSEPELLLTRPEIFSFLINSQNQKLVSLIQKQSLKYPELNELVQLCSLDIPKTLKVKYFPIDNRFESEHPLFIFFKIEISDIKKEVLKSLISSTSYSFNVDIVLDKKEMFKFIVADSQSKESSIQKFLLNKAVSLSIAGAVLGVSSFGGYYGVKNFETHKSATAENRLLKSYSLAVRELEKVQDRPQVFEALNNISPQELEYLSHALEHKDLAEVQENYKDVIVDKVKDLINSLQSERILYKTQKKIQSEENIEKIALQLVETSIENGIDYRILTSIIVQESKFDQGEISSSGDVALAQINYEIWKPEFDKQKLELDKDKLKKDEKYALWAMGVILSTIKKRYADKDPYWFARYHNNKDKRKFGYASLVNSHFLKFNKSQVSNVISKIDTLLAEIKITDFSKYNDVESSNINKFVVDLIKVKINLESSEIPSNIASN